MSALVTNPHVLAAAQYVPEWIGVDRTRFICLDRNECTQPMSNTVSAALVQQVTKGVNLYPDDTLAYAPLAEYCGVPESFLLATNGSDQAIDLVMRCFLGPGDRLLLAMPGFSVFKLVAELTGATLQEVPFVGDQLEFPYEDFSAALASRPRAIVFINPNNPTGTPVDLAYIEQTAADHPDLPVIVDEAYFEFTGSTVAPLIATHRNIIVLRTFSKAFAMAGLRFGYVIAAPEIIKQLAKIRNPFDVNSLAVTAAIAQLQAIDEVRRYVDETMQSVKPDVVRFLTDRGLTFVDGAANFLLVRPRNSAAAVRHLGDAGVLVRSMSQPPLNGTFRVSMGTRDEMDRFRDVFDEYLKAGLDE
ncbi:histidinol-phosphate transaminase [Catenulispora yoronensis]|uniref:histidinol-phosphate transaminase n=1 Tax=Catenulispora yoronensis TaxID=450799 RepID=A0ABN2TW92_9ACTN